VTLRDGEPARRQWRCLAAASRAPFSTAEVLGPSSKTARGPDAGARVRRAIGIENCHILPKSRHLMARSARRFRKRNSRQARGEQTDRRYNSAVLRREPRQLDPLAQSRRRVAQELHRHCRYHARARGGASVVESGRWAA
jgi:hypothetical protein